MIWRYWQHSMAADGPAVKAGYTWAAWDPLGLTALAATPGVPALHGARSHLGSPTRAQVQLCGREGPGLGCLRDVRGIPVLT